jgi:hypothetical protein
METLQLIQLDDYGTTAQAPVFILKAHKGQLFYCLKLQGKPVNKADYWGV